MYMSQNLCNFVQLNDFKCVMQSLLYKTSELENVSYLQHYIAATLGSFPTFSKKYFSKKNDIEELSLARVPE